MLKHGIFLQCIIHYDVKIEKKLKLSNIEKSYKHISFQKKTYTVWYIYTENNQLNCITLKRYKRNKNLILIMIKINEKDNLIMKIVFIKTV